MVKARWDEENTKHEQNRSGVLVALLGTVNKESSASGCRLGKLGEWFGRSASAWTIQKSNCLKSSHFGSKNPHLASMIVQYPLDFMKDSMYSTSKGRSGTACVEESREKSMLGTVQHEYFEKTAGNPIQAYVLIVRCF